MAAQDCQTEKRESSNRFPFFISLSDVTESQ